MEQITLRVERSNDKHGLSINYYINNEEISLIRVSRVLTGTYFEDSFGIFSDGDRFYVNEHPDKNNSENNSVIVYFGHFDFLDSTSFEIINELKRRAIKVRRAIEEKKEKPRVFDIAEGLFRF